MKESLPHLWWSRIEDRNGVEIYNHVPQTKDVLSKEIVYTIVKLLEGVTEAGSGMRCDMM